MKEIRTYFKDKKVTILGLGLLGKGLGDTVFLAQCGADVTVTDLKTEEQLAPSVEVFKKYKNVRLVLGRHEISDFENCDVVIKGQGAPLDSIYIEHARKNKIPVRMDDELFVSFLPKNVKVIGVTGTRGKTTTSTLIYHILKKSGKRVHLGGNIRGVATLSLLKKVKSGDIVVLELSSWQLQGFGESKISPNISVFTNFLHDHMTYYKNNRNAYFSDKAFIFKYQKKGDLLITDENITKKIPKSYLGKCIISHDVDVPKSWKLKIVGSHNKANVAIAIHVARALKISLTSIKNACESYESVEGRLQYVKTVRGIKIYNDNNSTTPEATIVALNSFPENKNKIVLIMGGADKGLDIKLLEKTVVKYTKKVVLLSGLGTDRLTDKIVNISVKAENLKDAVEKSMSFSEKGDIILFSPAFTSFSSFVNEYDRGDQFMAIVKNLK